MARKARIRVDGLPVHIVQRGHNKRPCFFEQGDYELYLGLLGEYAAKCACRVHAYVLMTNHVHLLMTPGDAWAFTRLMRHVNQHFVQYLNRTYRRCGSIWQGRFWSSIVETGDYLLKCQRYIELNPVRANMVAQPGEYRWSSHVCNGMGAPSLVISPHEDYLALGDERESRSRNYRSLFGEEMTDQELTRIREAVRAGRPLGSESFLDRLEAQLGLRARRGKPGPRPKPAQEAEPGLLLLP